MEVEEVAKPTAKGKGRGKGKSAGGTKAASEEAPNTNAASESQVGKTEKRRSLAVEEKYQKMTQREHIIKRPDTYSRILSGFVRN